MTRSFSSALPKSPLFPHWVPHGFKHRPAGHKLPWMRGFNTFLSLKLHYFPSTVKWTSCGGTRVSSGDGADLVRGWRTPARSHLATRPHATQTAVRRSLSASNRFFYVRIVGIRFFSEDTVARSQQPRKLARQRLIRNSSDGLLL